MKKFTKTLSVILALIMTFAMVMPVFAAESQSVVCPEIYVHGFATGAIYTNIDGKAEKIVYPEVDVLLDAVKEKIVPAALTYAADGDAKKLAYAITDLINTQFAVWFNNPDGSPANNSSANFEYPAASSIKKNSRVRFNYDWRGDPVEIAAQLNDYIDYVLATTGCEKVAISAHSFGSVVVLSYISIYGDDKIMGVVFDSPAMEGLTAVGELFCNRTDFKEEAIAALFKMIIDGNDYEELLNSIVDIFAMAGINGSISDFLNDAYAEMGDVIMEETLLPLFGCWSSVWAMIPDEYIDDAMEFVFDGSFSAEEYAGLKARVDSYNNLVRKDKKDTLLALDEEARVAVISRYGYNSVPMTKEWSMTSDTVIETKSSSLGATTAPYGDCFSDEYLEGKDMKYISPDKTIDASTCLFADKTWFIKNAQHAETSLTSKLYSKLLYGEQEATCDNSELARFMLYDRENSVLVEDNSEPVKAEKLTVFQRIFNFVKALIDKLLELLGK